MPVGCVFLGAQLQAGDAETVLDSQKILNDENLPEYLAQLGLFPHGASLELSPAGDGNINWVRRARSPERSFVVKQARPALEKFPEYEAPTERIACEARWLERARPFDTDGLCPEVLHFDFENRVLVLEDLSDSERMDEALARGAGIGDAAERIASLLGRLHAETRKEPAPELANAFANDGMRQLTESTSSCCPSPPTRSRCRPRHAPRRSGSSGTEASARSPHRPTSATCAPRARSSMGTCRPATCCSHAAARSSSTRRLRTAAIRRSTSERCSHTASCPRSRATTRPASPGRRVGLGGLRARAWTGRAPRA